MSAGPWDGMSLRYVRLLLGLPPWYADANTARQHSGTLRGGLPPVGAVCWYEAEPHGNVGVSLGEVETSRPMVICIRRGWPALRYYDDKALGGYLGWTERIEPPHDPLADPDPDRG